MDLISIVTDYRKKFVGKSCRVSTNYKALASFEVHFRATDLHHLFGFHKITRDYATKTLSMIDEGSFDLDSFSNSPNFREVVARINLYPFIGDVFIQNVTEYCVIRKDLKPNTMNLDVVFFEGDSKIVKVLGLRKDKNNVYRLVTLHEADARKYARVKKAKIQDIIWQ